MAPRAVLYDEHANGVACAKHGHAEEGVVNLFAGFGQIFERRMRLRVGQIERFGTGGDGAHKAFAHFQFGFMNGFALQAFRCVKFQHLAFAHDIDRADLGHHDGRDESDDLVQLVLRGLGFRHDFAQPPEQDTRAEGGRRHRISSSSPARAAPGAIVYVWAR